MTTNAHAHRMPPKPLRAAGLQPIEDSYRPYGPGLSLAARQANVYSAAAPASTAAAHRPAYTPIRNSTMRGAPYTCPELARHPRDPGRAATLPSRVGNRLHHPDGRVTELAGNPLEA